MHNWQPDGAGQRDWGKGGATNISFGLFFGHPGRGDGPVRMSVLAVAEPQGVQPALQEFLKAVHMLFLAPVDPPAQGPPEPDRHVGMETVNGKAVTEKHESEHGFVFAVYQLRGGVRFTDEEIINELKDIIFKLEKAEIN